MLLIGPKAIEDLSRMPHLIGSIYAAIIFMVCSHRGSCRIPYCIALRTLRQSIGLGGSAKEHKSGLFSLVDVGRAWK